MTTAVAPTVNDRAIEFIGSLILPNGRRIADTFESDPWQLERVLQPLLGKQPDDRPLYRYSWDERCKGSGKTTQAMAVALTECVMEPATHFYILASDAEQAGFDLEALAGLISRFPRLRAMVRQRNYLFTFTNGSVIRVMAADEPSFHGIGSTARRLRLLMEEITQWARPSLFYAAMASMMKVEDSRLRAVGVL